MIHLTKMNDDVTESSRETCETMKEAMRHFDRSTRFIVLRCDTDEELTRAVLAVHEKNQDAMKAAQMVVRSGPATCKLWQAKVTTPDGAGWRMWFEGAEATGQPRG
jgi:hypothetical protein